MTLTKTMFALAFGSVGITGAMSAHATAVVGGDVLTIGTTGSFFAMDTNGDGLFATVERINIKPGLNGLVIGTTSAGGPSHSGNPVDLDPGPGVNIEKGAIDQAWSFLGNTGSDFLVSAVTGDTTAGLDFSGWRLTWNGIPSINMSGGPQNCGTASDGICLTPGPSPSIDVAGTFNNGTGIAAFAWDGVYGHTYTVDYTAVVPQADSSGFGGVGYQLHLAGVVAVPEASTYGMMLAGLGLVGFMARRRTRA